MLELDLSTFPVLKTERLVLRELNLNDGEALYTMRSDERVMEHIGRKRANTIQDALDLINRILKDRKNNEGITWGLTLHNNETLIGTVGYYRLQKEHFRGEIGYLLSFDHWGKGLMSEALNKAVQFGFNEMGFHSIEAITDPANKRSWKVLEQNGFLREGMFKENFYWNGKFYDSAVYSKLGNDQDRS